nr:acetyl-CoA carboxylase biotin carboxyl carrier protein [Saprospiraceae bacterium]
MEYKNLLNLIKTINRSDLTEFKMKEGDFEVVIRTDKYVKSKASPVQHQTPMVPVQQPVVSPQQEVPSAPAKESAVDSTSKNSKGQSDGSAEGGEKESTEGLVEIKSPIVGTFYRSSSPDKPPYVKVGDQVEVGSVICIVEAMKLFNEIESEVSGKVVKVVVDDASPVEYDQVLFLVEPS